jgi:hypothetical protein
MYIKSAVHPISLFKIHAYSGICCNYDFITPRVTFLTIHTAICLKPSLLQAE